MTRRCFLAINLPAEVVRFLSIDAEAVSRLYDGRSTPAANLHITVSFFGAVSERDLPKLSDNLRSALSGSPRPDLVFEDVVFGPPGKPNPWMVWAKFRADGRFQALVQSAYEAARDISQVSAPRRRETPHVTLVRFRQPIDPVGRPPKSGLPAGYEFTAEEATLYESRLAPSGPAYEALDVIRFAD
jgi:2'-5' RNA ligase